MAEKKKDIRGNANAKAASAYADTVADYDSSSTVTGDNTLENITCDATVSVGSVVRMNGSTAVNAIADSTVNSRVIGICVSKSNATTCNILTCGPTGAILSGLTVNENYFLSATSAGDITTTAPTGSGQIVIHIGRPLTSTRLIIQIGEQIRRAT